jgi:hypothetical protein
MRVRRLCSVSAIASLTVTIACTQSDGSDIPPAGVDAITAVLAARSDARPVKLNHHALVPIWTVSKDQELACGGPAVAGGLVGGSGEFTHLGQSGVEVSVAWNVGNLIQTPARYKPVGPAGGPVAPVLGQNSYPYAFHRNPNTGICSTGFSATGKVVLSAASGDRVFGNVVGGEAHRLDFLINGDGVESFIEVAVTGGTGRFAGAQGSFVVHSIARLTPTLKFAVTLAEILPGGTLGY